MNGQDRQAIEGVFSRLGELERQGVTRDPQADTFIQSRMQEQPGAAYFLAQTVVVQDQALQAAQARIAELEQRAGAAGAGMAGASAGSGRPATVGAAGGSSLDYAFGRQPSPEAGAQAAAPGQPQSLAQKLGFGNGGQAGGAAQAAPAGNRNAPGAGGGGFLAGAMQTAMGVAGGMMLGNMLGGLFGGNEANAATPPEGTQGAEAAAPAQDAQADAGYDDGGGMDDGGGFDGGFDDF